MTGMVTLFLASWFLGMRSLTGGSDSHNFKSNRIPTVFPGGDSLLLGTL